MSFGASFLCSPKAGEALFVECWLSVTASPAPACGAGEDWPNFEKLGSFIVLEPLLLSDADEE